MYKVLQIIDYAATRDVVIRNIETGTVDICFDDSIMVSNKNFGFIEVGNKYSCKIQLFGNLTDNAGDKTLLCIINKIILVGGKKMAQVLVNEDIYYISQYQVKEIKEGETFLFLCSRKDLIQVNDVIHEDFICNYAGRGTEPLETKKPFRLQR